jgi:hypothetical protein
MWSIRVDCSLFREKIFCDLVARDPHMIAASKVDLIDGTILLAPVGELDPRERLGYVRYRA